MARSLHGQPERLANRCRGLLRHKAAVISLTQSAGLNLIKHGINVNAIAPGVVDGNIGMVSTRFSQNMRKAARQKASRRQCALAGSAEDLADGNFSGKQRG